MDSSFRRYRSSIELEKECPRVIERLIVPKFRDVPGHWAQDEIEKLYSLDVFEGNSSSLPGQPYDQGRFYPGNIKVPTCVFPWRNPSVLPAVAAKPWKYTFPGCSGEFTRLSDIKDGVARGIISGISANEFGPQLFLTGPGYNDHDQSPGI
jgi:hypothetical protein